MERDMEQRNLYDLLDDFERQQVPDSHFFDTADVLRDLCDDEIRVDCSPLEALCEPLKFHELQPSLHLTLWERVQSKRNLWVMWASSTIISGMLMMPREFDKDSNPIPKIWFINDKQWLFQPLNVFAASSFLSSFCAILWASTSPRLSKALFWISFFFLSCAVSILMHVLFLAQLITQLKLLLAHYISSNLKSLAIDA